MEIALFQPDIAPNAATVIRMAACLGLGVRIIEPAGFVWSDASFRRAGLDYVHRASVTRTASWDAFLDQIGPRRVVLLTTRAGIAYTGFRFSPADIILMGRESGGVPEHVHARADARLTIPMVPGMRSLNVAVACAMVTGEALRQTGGFPAGDGV